MARRPATYAQIEALPEHLVGEIIEGELVVSPRPAIPHAEATSALGMLLGPPFHFGSDGPGGWWILFEPELHFGSDVLVPDMAGWRRSRVPEPPRGAWIEIAPDWVCEVLSASTSRLDRVRKLPVYARERVAWLWLIDPEQRTLEVMRRRGRSWVLLGAYADDAFVRAPPFDAIELSLALLWGAPPKPQRKAKPRRRARR